MVAVLRVYVEIRGSASFRESAPAPTAGALRSSLGAEGKSELLYLGALSFLTVFGETERPRALPISSCALAE